MSAAQQGSETRKAESHFHLLVTSSFNASEPDDGLSVAQCFSGSVWACPKDSIVALLLRSESRLKSPVGRITLRQSARAPFVVAAVKGGIHRRREEGEAGHGTWEGERGKFGKMPPYR